METQILELEVGKEYIIKGNTYKYLKTEKDMGLHTFAEYDGNGIRRAEIFDTNFIGIGGSGEIMVISRRDICSSVIFSDDHRAWTRVEFSKLDRLLKEVAK